MKNIELKPLALNSALILVSSAILNTVLHELAHYGTASYLGLNAVLHHNYVELPKDTPPVDQVITAAAGPTFSLIFGIVVLFISIKYMLPSLSRLFFLWLGLGGILTFLGYILIAPVAMEGDTGLVFSYFNFPIYLTIALAVISFLVINKVFSHLAPQFVFYRSPGIFHQRQTARQLFVIPIFASIVITTLLNLPTEDVLNLAATLFMPLAYFSIMGDYYKIEIDNEPVVVAKVSLVLIFITLICCAIFRILV